MRAQPCADARQTFERRLGQLPVGLGAYVEEQVAAAPRRTREVADEVVGGLVVAVGDAVPPRTVHRLAGFERQAAHLLSRESGGVLTREVALEGLGVLALEGREVVVVDDQTGGLQPVDQPV